MKKIDPIVCKETFYILYLTTILSVLMQSVFLIIGKWDYTVLLGNLLGIAAATGNFLLMGLAVQKALEKTPEEAKTVMKLSQMGRMLMLFGVALVGYLVPVFHVIAVILPFLFPRVAIALRPLFKKD